MTDLEFLKEAEAWLSFNNFPSREQIATFKESLKQQIAISECAPQNQVNAFEFAEWIAANYVRLSGCWVHAFKDQRDQRNWQSTDTLWQYWANNVRLHA